jgi:hypothetical protein
MEEQFDEGMAIENAALPQRMEVDCVRVWQVQPRRKS